MEGWKLRTGLSGAPTWEEIMVEVVALWTIGDGVYSNNDDRTGGGSGLLHLSGEDGKGPAGKQCTANDASMKG